MLRSIKSNNSPGHFHNRLPSVVDLSTDFCPGIILKRNNKMKHTQGKWEVDRSGIAAINIKSTNKKFVAGIHNQDKRIEGKKPSDNDAYDTSETDANANLIASAPEMLELLKKIAHGEVDGVSCETLDLIAKAEGNTDYLIMAELYRQTKAEDK